MKITGVVLFILGFCKLTATLTNHYYINEVKAWSVAQAYCRRNYEDLSTIQTQNELKLLSIVTAARIWIGLHRDDEDQWKWSGGGDMGFRDWGSEEPSNVSGFDCVSVKIKSKKWSATLCSAQLTFFCMETLPELSFVQQNKTWVQAVDYCRAQYTDLASLQIEEVNTMAVNVSQAAQTAFVWIGLRFLAGNWFWVSGRYLGYQAWGTGQQFQCPAQNLRCGTLETNNKVWMPLDCDQELNFICF